MATKAHYAWECIQHWDGYVTRYGGTYRTRALCERACRWHAAHGSGPHPRPRRMTVESIPGPSTLERMGEI